MTERDERKLWERIGVEYNPPVETPREEMWQAIEARLQSPDAAATDGTVGPVAGGAPAVLGLEAARERRGSHARTRGIRTMMGWSVAAAALLVLGVGIGRMSVSPTTSAGGVDIASTPTAAEGNGLAARTHLGRTEALLTMVRADARDGRVDPAVAVWAEDLLAQTRLLLDRPQGVEPGLQDLLLDLELVLVQVVGLAETDSDDPQARTEVELTLKTLDEGEVLPRIQAQIPLSMAGA
mgnify:CR=1 FL=1